MLGTLRSGDVFVETMHNYVNIADIFLNGRSRAGMHAYIQVYYVVDKTQHITKVKIVKIGKNC